VFKTVCKNNDDNNKIICNRIMHTIRCMAEAKIMVMTMMMMMMITIMEQIAVLSSCKLRSQFTWNNSASCSHSSLAIIELTAQRYRYVPKTHKNVTLVIITSAILLAELQLTLILNANSFSTNSMPNTVVNIMLR